MNINKRGSTSNTGLCVHLTCHWKIIVVVLWTLCLQSLGLYMSPRVILLKQGPIQGFIGPESASGVHHLPHPSGRPFNRMYSGRPVVEIFRGVPYASPPTGTLRYETPLPVPLKSRTEPYFANVTKPSCPSSAEEVRNRTTFPRNPYKALKRLKDSVEDCLYLDIYAPLHTVYTNANAGDKLRGNGLPILVYMNSHADDPKNPFDGSSMAAIGNIIVVSVRYRTGVLGFLQPSYSDDVRSNFGLWDQLAALHWIKENIGEFGGDSSNICLMGYDIDATIAGLLALSPVSQANNGLFQRLILINGSPFAPNALNTQPIRTTYHLAKALPCPSDDRGGELANCLRSVPISRLMNAAERNIGVVLLTNPFAPTVDGTLIPRSIDTQNEQMVTPLAKEMLGKYDVLCGLKEGPVLPTINNHRQLFNLELDRFITAAIKLAMKMDLGEPTDKIKRAVLKALTQDHAYGPKPNMREVISDFLIVNPMIELLNAHSLSGRNTFFYVFKDYNPLSLAKDNELSYIFSDKIYNWKFLGFPSHSYKLHQFIVLIDLIANFVRKGDPNIAEGVGRFSKPENSWPKYQADYGRYLEISGDIKFPSGYRKTSTDFWGKTFPSLIRSFANSSDSEDSFGDFPPTFTRNRNRDNLGYPYHPNFPPNSHDNDVAYPPKYDDDTSPIFAGGQSTVVLVGCILLLLNFLCFMGLFYQKERLKKAEIQLRKRYIEAENQVAATKESTQEVEASSSIPERSSPVRQHHQLPRDNMSETETENGFGPDFLGPNYDPRTKVNRWMQMQNAARMKGASFEDYSNPTPTPPSDVHRQRLSRAREDENLYETAPNLAIDHQQRMMRQMHPQQSLPAHYNSMPRNPQHIYGMNSLPPMYHPQYPTTAPPLMQHPVNSLQRRKMPQPPKAQPEPPVQFVPQLPYQGAFKPVGSDIPYADSRATSPSIISAPAGFSAKYVPTNPQSSKSTSGDKNAEVKPVENSSNDSNAPEAQALASVTNGKTSSETLRSKDSSEEANKPNSILVTPTSTDGPKRSSTLIVRDLDPVDPESEPKYVSVRHGTLKRSVAVDTDHDDNGTAAPVVNEDSTSIDKGPKVRVTFKENL